MLPRAECRPEYSRAERVSDACVHLVALGLAMAAVPVLITLAVVWRGDLAAVVGASVYGVTLISMIGASALYNGGLWPGLEPLFLRLDHSAIYFKIAGTFTPFAMFSGTGAGLLAGLWGAALAGAGLKIAAPERFRWFGFALYLAMGWVGAWAGWHVFETVSEPVFWLIVAGGVTYTGGTVFYLAKGRMFHNTLWHVCVMAASVVFFVGVALHLAATAG